jgi:hypothetical protein
VWQVSRLGLIVVCSVVVLLTGLLISRLAGWLAGPVVALLGGAAAVAGVLFPQPVGQLAAAALPGFASLLAVLATMATVRWVQRRRITYLPGFARGRGEAIPPSGTALPSSGRAQPRPTGSTGPHEEENRTSATPAMTPSSRSRQLT